MTFDHTTARALSILLHEIVDGPKGKEAFVLNPGDAGLLRSLDALSATDASTITIGGSSIAAHVDHLRYGLELMNRWSNGENPFSEADYSASWRRTTVDDAEWKNRRVQLRDQLRPWMDVVATPRAVNDLELTGIISSVVHLAYHLGAMRQMNSAMKGPKAND